ncbi:hypothetical protein QAD02_019108 [Eretmocerus hayati]|uniref:Uncharacterized protein n=1 Tax=Eretmocerus hayati TaxID=131215 RepID=A0ACC2PIQ2_9HYME|nr:hypothetical protein QAD02_019108 [Eretmocerus hayati]
MMDTNTALGIAACVLISIATACSDDHKNTQRLSNGGDLQSNSKTLPMHYYEEFDPVNQNGSELLSRRKRSGLYGFYDFQHYPFYEEIEAYLKNLAHLNNDVEFFTIGKSYEGRDIMAIKISNGASGNPILFIDGGIHGREWVSPTSALYAIQQFIVDRMKYRWLYNIDIVVVPLLNPDGYEYSRTHDRMWRKNRSWNRYTGCMGVHLNRNFDIDWNHSSQVRDPCKETYAGPAAFSEPETQALRDYFNAHGSRIKVHVTIHSPITAIMYPWGIAGYRLPWNQNILECLAGNAASAVKSKSKSDYRVGSVREILKKISAGSSIDWTMIHEGAKTSFALELPGKYPNGEYNFQPAERYIVYIGEQAYAMLKVFAKFTQTEECHNTKNHYPKQKPRVNPIIHKTQNTGDITWDWLKMKFQG